MLGALVQRLPASHVLRVEGESPHWQTSHRIKQCTTAVVYECITY